MSCIILHIDMNSYFASVEQQANPHLRGVPVGVCEHLGGIIIAPSVEAKRMGIKLGTPVWKGRKIYPGIVLLPVDPPKYRHVTMAFLRILEDYTAQVERYSIDEAFVDVSEYCAGNYDNALLLALEIKQRLRREVGEWVSASIGIGPNKLIAKIAADLDGGFLSVIASPAFGGTKQSQGKKIASSSRFAGLLAMAEKKESIHDDKNFLDRICVVRPEDIAQLYDRLKLTDIPGIAHRLEHALNKLGIFTLRELAVYPLENLLNRFGVLGYQLHRMGNFDLSQFSVIPATVPESRGWIPGQARDDKDLSIKSIGHSYTLPKAINDIREIKKLMYKLAEKIGRRMRRQGARGNVVHYFHSDKRYEGFGRQHKIKEFINDGREIYRAAWGIFMQSVDYGKQIHSVRNLMPQVPADAHIDWISNGVKIMGISVSGLKFNKPPESLFENLKKPLWLVAAMDRINDKYGEFTVRRGRLLGIDESWASDTVGFGRIKELGGRQRR